MSNGWDGGDSSFRYSSYDVSNGWDGGDAGIGFGEAGSFQAECGPMPILCPIALVTM